MTSLRLYLRSVLLEWLGYNFHKSFQPGLIHAESTTALLLDIKATAMRVLLDDIEIQVGLLRVPEVSRGVVRIVVEVSR